MTSRTTSPLSVSSSSPGRSPAAAAGEPGATATTRAVGIAPVYGSGPASLGTGTLGRVPVEQVLLAQPRGFCAGVEMAIKALVVDGAGVRAARVLLPRDRAQPARGRPVPRARGGVRRRRRRGARRRPAHALGPRLRPRGGRRRPRPRPVRGERGVPARHQGPPRGQGAGGQGLHRALRRPRAATTRPSGTLAVAPDVDPAGRARGRPRRPCCPTVDDPSKVALLAQTTLSHARLGGHRRPRPRRVPRALDRDPQRPLLRDHQPAGRAAGDRGARPTPSS